MNNIVLGYIDWVRPYSH